MSPIRARVVAGLSDERGVVLARYHIDRRSDLRLVQR